ncbi:MAG: hypothetical protein AAGJ32_04095 [Pseudomonadota bacterium]
MAESFSGLGTIVLGPISNLTFSGGAGDNRLIGTSASDTLNGLGGNDQVFGFAGADTLSGGSGNDEIFGGGGIDTINGGDGDDRLTGGGGNDIINGGAGIDTLVFSGRFTDYIIDTVNGVVTDTRGIEGTDTFTGIENFQFGNSNVIFVPLGDSINAAIDGANDGDTILLDDGVYREQVSIIGRSGIEIVGSGNTVIEAPDSLLAFNVISPPGGARDVGAVIEVAFSSDITITGVEIDGRGVGLDAVAASGAPTDFPTNFAGVLMLNSSGTVDNVDITGVRDPLDGGSLNGNQTGDAIAVYNGDGEPRSVTVSNSTLEDFQKTGARFSGDGLTVLVSTNTVEGAGLLTEADAITQNGFTIEQGATGRFEFNQISEVGNLRGDFAGAGILAVDPGDGMRFFANTISGPSDGSGGFLDSSLTGILIVGSANNTGVFQNTFEGLLAGVAGIQDVDNQLFGGNTFSNMIPSFTPITGGGQRPGLNIAVSGIENERPLDISTSDGPDLLQGTNFDDRIFSAGGDDFLSGEGGNDLLDGREGNDTLRGGDGNDQLIGRAGNDLLDGGEGADNILGGGGRDRILGNSGNDFANGGGGDDVLNGGTGSDTLIGNMGNDVLNGGADVDRLEGGAGDDTIRGQGGLDTFVFNASDTGSDTVIGFQSGETVELNGFGFANVAAATAAFSQDGTDVVFTAGTVAVRFTGTNLNTVTANIALDAATANESITRVDLPASLPEPDPLGFLDDGEWAQIA